MGFAEELQRFGLLLPLGSPTVVLAGTHGDIDRLYPAIDAALRQHPHYRLVLAAAETGAMRKYYPHELILPLPHSVAWQRWLRRLGVVLVIGPSALSGLSPAGFVDSSKAITPTMLAALLPPLAVPERKPSRGSFLIGLFGGPAIASLHELAEKLGKPRTIVCLGNGPSSEDPRLADFSDAALFRVNWNWRGRNWLTAPDMVFTADPDLPGAGRRPLIAFPTAVVGRPILLRHLRAMRPPSAGYVFIDEIDPPVADLAGPMIATNGALMIAIAAALEPERIVIAGMDLYQHPEGRYPGDTTALDGYSRQHSAEIDLKLVRSALSGFDGETIILSDNLRLALAAR
ncbi:hypothetical protein [Mesorhizobium sp. NZP2077]|uniref:hypothetical protein n=1 Tax=Mesorhizobium sp. NZP2077 TaxID=2483404 RepID=UPI0015533C80|nr:hypothetical protein [Mesorhizobium sp. NZP2077]QKC85491.1 hypothetical protein EB232_31585 [Mesorhizobium sp. NZP2077]QKD19128.1 hypothetical protein HGP13_31280 [Mesorhizobium sp. NZP2077]